MSSTSHDPRSLVTVDADGFPCVESPVLQTEAGTRYLTAPGIALLSRPSFRPEGLAGFLAGFQDELGFDSYLADPVPLSPGAGICKAAGQLCYLSFGPRRSMNADGDRYFDNIRESGHGSVLEHANYSMLIYGVSRSLTHELVRHRAGFAFSQVSQRYVSPDLVRFVERPEFRAMPELHALFEERIDRLAQEHLKLCSVLSEQQTAGAQLLHGDSRTDARKKLQQAARAALSNETEAPIIVTGNARAWRHFLAMRGSEHAELEIRALAALIWACLVSQDALLFGDFRLGAAQDGAWILTTPTPRV